VTATRRPPINRGVRFVATLTALALVLAQPAGAASGTNVAGGAVAPDAAAAKPAGGYTIATNAPASSTTTSAATGSAGTPPATTGTAGGALGTSKASGGATPDSSARSSGTGKLSTGAILAAVIGGLLALACLAWAALRWTAVEPRWTLPLRHSMAEAGFRASAVWAEFTDWIRLGH
jgi:hypothetical protein